MATYLELADFMDNPEYKKRVYMAIIIAAKNISENVNSTAPQKEWANNINSNGLNANTVNKILRKMLLDNKDASASAIANVLGNDNQVQVRINNNISNIISGNL